MARGLIALIVISTIVAVAYFALQRRPVATSSNSIVRQLNIPKNEWLSTPNTNSTVNATPSNVNANESVVQPSPAVLPIADFYQRVTKKPFGIYITPATSPVQPERFKGYHTGADAETTTAEHKSDVPIYSVAAGTVVLARYVSGYGGVIMITVTVNGKTYTTLYGHLRQSSFTVTLGTTVTKGEKIAVLGTGFSSETDGERKHLHFGVLQGSSTNVKGYVSTKSQLSPWEDPVAWLKWLNAGEPS